MSDADLMVLEFAIELMYQNPAIAHPALPISAAKTWRLRAYLSALDALWRPRGRMAFGSQRVFYGALLESVDAPGQFVIAIRGTEGLIEWAEDSEFELVKHPEVGNVEAGFFGLYGTFQCEPADSSDGAQPALDGLRAILGRNPVTVIGHSLGAALATYLAYDLAASNPVRARLFCSPRPGDTVFASGFAQRVRDHTVYVYKPDIVPDVPIGFGYCPLPNLITITPAAAKARIRFSLDCFHHVICLAMATDPAAVDLSQIPPAFANCIVRAA